MKRFIIIIISIVSILNVNAQTTATFTNGGGDDSWDNPQNWDTGQVPGSTTNVVIPADFTVAGPESNYANVNSISNSGTLILQGNSKLHTDHITNSGTLKLNERTDVITNSMNNTSGGLLVVDKSRIKGEPGNPCNITNSGNIYSHGGGLDVSDIDTFSNFGNIDVTEFITEDMQTFMNQGNLNTAQNIYLPSNNFANTGTITSGFNISIVSNYAYNNGKIQSNEELVITTMQDYLRKGGNSNIISVNGKIHMTGNKGLQTGRATAGSSKKKQSKLNENTGLLEIAIDTNWVVGDTVKLEGNTIRFIFDYLEFMDIDSIKSIYADSKIEFYGTPGSTLSFQYNNSQDIFWTDAGSIEIYSDNIIPPSQGLNYLFHPDPVTGPSDTTFISTFIESRKVSDSTGSSGDFRLHTRSTCTGHRIFNYKISSALGWVSTTTGTTQLLAPFQFDSLVINYDIPYNGDTLVDTVMVILSIPGEHADTAYSYIRSYPGLTVGFDEFPEINTKLDLQVFPNPFYSKVCITSNKDARIIVSDIKGRTIDEFSITAVKEKYWLPPSGTNKGLLLISVLNDSSVLSRKVLFWGGTD